MLQLLKKLAYRKRVHERQARDGVLVFFSAEGPIGQGELLDESEGGARVRTTCTRLRELHYALAPQSGMVAKVQIVWQAEGCVGLRYLSRINIRGYANDPAITHIRDAWRTMAFDYQRVASRGAFSR